MSRAEPCADNFGRVTDASQCFGRHPVLRRLMERSGAPYRPGPNYVQRRLMDVPNSFALAFLGEGESCAIHLSDQAAIQYVESGNLTARFLSAFAEPLRALLDGASNDCMVEAHYSEVSSGSHVGFAIIDFIEQPSTDGIPDGIAIVDPDDGASASRVFPLLYLRHAKANEIGDLRWSHPGVVDLMATADQQIVIHQLATGGYVTRRLTSPFVATYLMADGRFDSYRICTQAELRERHGAAVGAMGKFLQFSDTEIAIRAVPGGWYEDESIEAAAYVLCERWG